ncbi:hypothetical protein J6590_096884 [Homalodisca vitripennis]|nr:hypothetical protein J6590_096884 [Homalodisca vitripennis]
MEGNEASDDEMVKQCGNDSKKRKSFGRMKEFTVTAKSLELELKNAPESKKANITKDINRLKIENDVHKRKAEQFYARKRQAKRHSKRYDTQEAICIDYGKTCKFLISLQTTSTIKGNCPSMLLMCMFCLMLKVYSTCIPKQKDEKVVTRFLFNLVNYEKRFESVTVTFPIRGHSYMENDKNMGLINTKSRAEVPEDWVNIVKESRRNPSSFEVEVVNHTAVRGWTSFLDKTYATKCPFQSRPVRELHIARGHHLRFRTSYFGAWENASLYKTVPKRGPRRKNQRLPPVNIEVSDEFNLPDSCYEGCFPIAAEKYKDLQDLKKFLSRSAAEYFDKLPHVI